MRLEQEPTMPKASFSLVAIALLAGCAAINPPSKRPTLGDSEWRITALDGKAPAGEATLAFAGDRIAASAGCNRMSGSWKMDAGRLVVGQLASTRMFCEGKMEQEQALSQLLDGGPDVTMSDDRMMLKTPKHSAELERTKG
jgi:heat shock protein HslJ